MKKIMFAIMAFIFLGVVQANGADVRGYTRSDGTYVAPYQRTNPDSNPHNNYNFPGNYNPNSGRTTPGNQDTYLERYNNRDNSSGFGNSDFNSRRRR